MRGGGAHLDGLIQSAHVHSRIDRRLLLNREGKSLAREFLESVGLDCQNVQARRQGGDHESAGLVGHRRLARASIGIRDGDRRARHQRTRRILDRTADRGGERLSERNAARQDYEREALKQSNG